MLYYNQLLLRGLLNTEMGWLRNHAPSIPPGKNLDTLRLKFSPDLDGLGTTTSRLDSQEAPAAGLLILQFSGTLEGFYVKPQMIQNQASTLKWKHDFNWINLSLSLVLQQCFRGNTDTIEFRFGSILPRMLSSQR